jgi:hypothetical protein
MTDETRDLTAKARELARLPLGVTVTARLEHDVDVDPRTDGDWATPEDIAAWKADEWEYVGIIVDVTDEHGRMWGDASIWAVDHGYVNSKGKTSDALMRDDLIDGLVSEAVDVAVAAAQSWATKWAASQGPADTAAQPTVNAEALTRATQQISEAVAAWNKATDVTAYHGPDVSSMGTAIAEASVRMADCLRSVESLLSPASEVTE